MLAIIQKILEGELIIETTEEKITPDNLQAYVKAIEEQSIQTNTAFIFNDNVFETGSCIIRHKGHWVFWHEHKRTFMTWCWQEDMNELINACDDEMDMDNLNQGWTLYQGGGYEPISYDHEWAEQELDKFVATLSPK